MDATVPPGCTLTAPARELATPCCPQFRAAQPACRYPHVGYCIAAAPAGHVLVPSIAEYGTFCTTPRFSACRWYRDPALGDERKAA